MLCIAHRGSPITAQTTHPENSLAAIDNALALGVDAIEIDIWHLHNELWVTHDHRLGRQITGSEQLIDLSTHALEELRLANGEPLPKLVDVLTRVGERALLNIEIKNPGCADLLSQQLQEYRTSSGTGLEHYVVSSFNHHELFAMLQLLPQVKRGVLLASVPLNYAACCEALAAYSLNTSLLGTPKELVDDAHKRGLTNWVYTANFEDEWTHLLQLGVDGVFTDRAEAFMVYRSHTG
ncbi:MAG TPA: glycerophosphodiester phosphodiesterase [Cellvibrionaceae bacterium]